MDSVIDSTIEVRTGFRVEWPLYTGRGKVRNGANIAWIIWLVVSNLHGIQIEVVQPA
jgi:hypothetical protein